MFLVVLLLILVNILIFQRNKNIRPDLYFLQTEAGPDLNLDFKTGVLDFIYNSGVYIIHPVLL